MNGYVCFYKGQRVETHANTTFDAQKAVAKQLGVKDKDRYKITVCLAEKNGEQVTHSTDILT